MFMDLKDSTPIAEKLGHTENFKFIRDFIYDWISRNRKPRTYSTYKERLQLFLNALDDSKLTVSNLKPYHVTRFVDKHPTWSPTMRRWGIGRSALL